MPNDMHRLLASMLGLPAWVQAWMVILLATNMAAFAFLDTDVGFWTAGAFAVVAAFNLPMMVIQGGLTRLLSVPHFVWLALVPYLFLSLFGSEPLPPGSTRHFAVAVLVVNSISLMFDFLEVYRWLKGQREVLGISR
ncbi:MAG: hypothetical protein A3E01_14860 [Gammaproteobacteria bacterium RIFCSPHIGHO2_12_FULL_63_22]|nr:MAG: hypothetical protein A3E01_14860 [Gammaproteobacteria bacterium RIFCSPHIGHO2_12_FULL_63_22]